MNEFLKHMMNCGLLIYQRDDRFILQKTPTPADHRVSITNRVKDKTNELDFGSWEEAIAKAKKLCSTDQSITCEAMLKLVHKGRGQLIWELSNQQASSPKEAQDAAEKEAIKLMSDKFDMDSEVEQWEVRIRPLKK